MTLMFRMAEFQRAAFERLRARATRSSGAACTACGTWCARATEAGELELPREDMLFFATPHEHEVSVNSTRVTRVLGTDVWDLSYAEWCSRRQMRQIAAFLRKYVPGFEESYVVQSGVQVGVRETRRIIGEYQLDVDDVLGARKFDDAIARGAYPVDIHNPEGQRHGAQAPAAGRGLRHPAALPAAAERRAPDRRRALHLRHATRRILRTA